MVARLLRLSPIGKLVFVVAVLGVLIGCLVGGRSILNRQQGASPMAEEASPNDGKMPGGWYSVQITRAEWKPAWLGSASSSTFTGEAEIQSLHGFVFVAFGEMRIKDSSGRLVRSWLEVKRIRCSKHANDSDKIEGHRGTATFVFTWDGTDGGAQPVSEGSSTWEFTVCFRLKKDSRTGSIGIDKTTPSIRIDEPQGEITSTSASLAIAWNDTASGVDASTGHVSLDGSAVSDLSLDATGARGALTNLSEGSHRISASVKDLAGNEGSASGSFTVKLPVAVEQRTSLLGNVADSSGNPLAGVSVSSSSATGSVTTDSEGKFFIEMTSGGQHWLTFDKEGYIPVERWAEVTENQHYNTGEVRMVAQDPTVTTIGPEGGTARDSSGDVELEIPAGALSEPVDIRMTHIPSAKELPGPLNASDNLQYPIDYTLCVAIEPADLAFNVPATLRYPNKWGFEAGEKIPTAIWDMVSNRWIPDGGYLTVAVDGSRLEKILSALATPQRADSLAVDGTQSGRQRPTSPSSHRRIASAEKTQGAAASAWAPWIRLWILDGNLGKGYIWGGFDTGGPAGTAAQDPDKKPCTPSNSSLTISDSGYQKSLSLPPVTGPGGGQALSFTYRSETAFPSAFINYLYFNPDVNPVSSGWKYQVEVNGQRKEVVFATPSGPSRVLFFWDSRNGQGAPSPTGLYTSTVMTAVLYPYGSYFVRQSSWGAYPTDLTTGFDVQGTTEMRRIVSEAVPLVNETASQYGAGWSLSGIRRLYPQSDGKVLLVDGGEPGTIYYPYVNFARVADGASVVAVPGGNTGMDPRNMLGYHGTGLALANDSTIQYQDGFMFGPSGSVVVDLGQVRRVHTLGLSYRTFDPVPNWNNALINSFEIYTSPDNTSWTLWSKSRQDIIYGMTTALLTSPYLATKSEEQDIRYVKYVFRAEGSTAEIYRLYAFGSSDRYGNGENGRDEDYPMLRRLDEGGWEQTERDGTRYGYDSKGLMQSIADIHGNVTTYTWTAEGLLAQITDAAAGVTSLGYENGKLREVTDAAGRRTAFTVASSGDLTRVTLPDGSSMQFGYDARHLIQSETDPGSHTTTYTWDPVYPNLKKVTRPGGGEIITDAGYFNHLVNGLTGTEESPAPSPGISMESTRTDELGRTTTYKWEAYGPTPSYFPTYRSMTTDSTGRTIERYLHPRMGGLEVRRIEPDGSTIQNTYDAEDGRFVLKVEDLSDSAAYRTKGQFTYEPAFKKVATSADIGGHTTSYSYSEKGDLLSVADPLGNTTTMSYDEKGRLASVTDAEAAVTRYEYDARSNRTKATDPLGRISTMTYDPAGNMTSLTDPAGRVTRWDYDPMGRAIKVTDPAGGETRYVYQPGGGGCTSGCGGGGGAGGLLTSITDPASHTTSFEYDTDGRMTAVVNALGARREYSYDQAGRLVKFRNARGQEITYQYDSSNNLVKKTLPDEGDVDYGYDGNDRLTQVRDADSVLKYEYAEFTGAGPYYPEVNSEQLKGSRIKESFGLSRDARYAKQISGSVFYGQGGEFLDQSGNPVWAVELPVRTTAYAEIDGGVIQTNSPQATYDAAHRVISLYNRPCADTWFTYDKVGRRKTMEVSVEGCQSCGGGGEQNKALHPRGASARMAASAADSVTFERVQWLKSSYGYDAAGQVRTIAQSYDSSQATNVPIGTYAYDYDAAGNRTSMQDATGTHSYGYDSKYQLVSATHPAEPAESFGYDLAGNRTTSHISFSYSYNAGNQLLEDAEYVYAYDADGNCIQKLSKLDGTRHQYIFNSENRMTGYRKYDINSNLFTTADYFYDPIGRRIAKEVDGRLTRFLYQDEDIWLVIDPDGVVTRVVHGPGIDEPIVSLTEGNDIGRVDAVYTYYFPDALGSIRNTLVQDCDILTSTSYDFDSFGQPTSTTALPTLAPAYAFTGREWDAESYLFHFRARYYDPREGRFIAEDPIPHANLYPYVVNDPVNQTDPYGACNLQDECPSGTWTLINWAAVPTSANLGFKAAESFKVTARCTESCKPTETRPGGYAEISLTITCSVKGVIAELGIGALPSGQIQNACDKTQLPGTYTGVSVGLKLVTAYVAWKDGGDQWMTLAYGSIGIGARLGKATCIVSSP